MSRLRWGADTPEDPDAARERLLDAAGSCFERYGIAKTTMDDVAAVAQVSRPTVYRYFANRDELVLGYLVRGARRFLAQLTRRVARQPTVADAIVEGVVETVASVHRESSLARLLAPEAVGETRRVPGAYDAVFALNAEYLRPALESARDTGELRADVDLDAAAEWVLRATLSLLSVPGTRRRRRPELRRFVHTFLVPALFDVGSRVDEPLRARR